MRKIISFFLISLILVSCANIAPYKPIISGLASPLNLKGDSTLFFLTDYVIDFNSIDSLAFPEGLNSYKINDSVLLISKTGTVKPLSEIHLYSEGNKESILIVNREKEKVVIEFKSKEIYKNMKVIGTMNNWNRTNSGMELKDGVWKQEFMLSPGTYEYLFYTMGKEFPDPSNPMRIGNNSLIKVGKFMPEELPFLATRNFTNNTITFTSSQTLDSLFAFWQNTSLNISVTDSVLSLEIPKHARNSKRSFIRIFAYNSNGISNDILIPLENGAVVTNANLFDRTDKQTMIMYFLMVDRFFNGDTANDEPVNDPTILPKANYYGGDLFGVNTKIEENYFASLGINTLWLSPISQNPKGAFGQFKNPDTKFSGYHGYWPISNIRIDYRFGNPEIFQTLVDKAHTQQLNVLLDYVAHHVHQEHPAFQMHPAWFTSLYLPDGSLNTEKWDEYRLTTWFDTFMPTLDLRRKDVVDAMVDSAVYWINQYGIDGFRHDATKHIDELYWRTLTQKINKSFPDKPFYQIGETYGSPILISSYISSGMLDAQFDFNVYDNAVACFALDNESFNRLKTTLSESWKYYGYNNLMGNISGNQDRARFISYAGGSLLFSEDAKSAGWNRDIGVGDTTSYQKLKMLHAFNMTIPGIPVIYYGDEIGLPGGNDPDNRRMMKFDNLTFAENDVKQTVTKLISIRKNSLPLLYGQTQIIQADEKVFSFIRNYFSSCALVIFNKSKDSQTMEFKFPNNKDTFEAHFNSPVQIENGKLIVTLNPNSFEIITY